MQIVKKSGLSWYAVNKAIKLYTEGDEPALKPSARGRKQGTGRILSELLVLAMKRGKMARINDGKSPSILVNKKGPIKALIRCCKRSSEWLSALSPDVRVVQVIERIDTSLFAHQFHDW